MESERVTFPWSRFVGKRLCCTPKAKLNKRTGACTDPDAKVCYLYGNDLMSTTPHPCDSCKKLTDGSTAKTVEKDFREAGSVLLLAQMVKKLSIRRKQ